MFVDASGGRLLRVKLVGLVPVGAAAGYVGLLAVALLTGAEIVAPQLPQQQSAEHVTVPSEPEREPKAGTADPGVSALGLDEPKSPGVDRVQVEPADEGDHEVAVAEAVAYEPQSTLSASPSRSGDVADAPDASTAASPTQAAAPAPATVPAAATATRESTPEPVPQPTPPPSLEQPAPALTSAVPTPAPPEDATDDVATEPAVPAQSNVASKRLGG